MLFSHLKAIFTKTRLFTRSGDFSSAWDILKWWELRRIPFNLIVGITGFIGGLVCILAALLSEHITGREPPFPDPPLFIFAAIIIYGISANLIYCGGFLAELLARRIWSQRSESFGEISFCLGTIFSVIITILPCAFYTSILFVIDISYLFRTR